MFKNMKIAITDDVHLRSVCEVLDSMWYECGNQYFFDIKNLKDGLINSVATYESGSYYLHQNTDIDLIYNCNTVTLSNLLRMRDEMVREGAMK